MNIGSGDDEDGRRDVPNPFVLGFDISSEMDSTIRIIKEQEEEEELSFIQNGTTDSDSDKCSERNDASQLNQKGDNDENDQSNSDSFENGSSEDDVDSMQESHASLNDVIAKTQEIETNGAESENLEIFELNSSQSNNTQPVQMLTDTDSSPQQDMPVEVKCMQQRMSTSIPNTSEEPDTDNDEEEEDSIKDDDDDEDRYNKEGEEEGANRKDEEYNSSDESEPEPEEFSDDIDEDEMNEIDSLLEQGLPESQRTPKRKKNLPDQFKRSDPEYNEKEIIVLEEKGKNTFEVLPTGWIEVRHCSGMPLYLHRKTRICTLAKPYFLGTGSVRRHSIPLSSIPCLAYRRALADEEKDKTFMRQVTDKSIANDSCTDNIDASEPQKSSIAGDYKEDNNSTGSGVRRESGEQNESIDKTPLDTLFSNDKIPQQGCKINRDSLSRKRKLEGDENSVQQRNKLICLDLNAKKQDTNLTNDEERCITSTSTTKHNDEAVKFRTIHAQSGDASTLENNVDPDTLCKLNMLPLAKVATAKENYSMCNITPADLREYCQSLFNFKSVKCKRFKTWSARRKHTKEQKRLQLQRPSLPEGVKLISFPVHNSGGTSGDNGKGSKEYIMNPQGKSSVCILHEYVQHALRKQPSYIFKELENASTPYAATVVINSMQYGTGYGSSKKQAKADAAKATLEILIPEMKEQLDGKKSDSDIEFDFISFFEPFGLFDAGIPKLCKNFSEPPPYGLLLTCLQRNFGQGMSSNVKFDMIATGNQCNKFQMQVGEHSVDVTAANKREGKQLASQHLLSKLHPNVHNFGAFIKLYGNSSIKSVKEKKQEEQQITTLQSKASANSPNWAILTKLKNEMQKLVDNKDKDISSIVVDKEILLVTTENEDNSSLNSKTACS